MIRIGDTPGTLSVISALKDRLGDIIEPDFGLLDELLRLEVLSRRQCARIRSERTVYERNDALLELLTTEERCNKFLKALQRTHQQHVSNFIVQDRGQKHIDVVTYQLNVACSDELTLLYPYDDRILETRALSADVSTVLDCQCTITKCYQNNM